MRGALYDLAAMPARRWSQAAALSLLVPAICLLFAVAAFAQGSPSPSPGASGGQPLPGDPARGSTLYAANCTQCHGAALEGSGIAPKLAPIARLGNVPDPLDPAYLIEVITTGLQNVGPYKIMPAKGGNPKLSEQDVKDLAAFIIDTNQHPGEQPLSPGDLARSNVFWVAVGIGVMALFTYLLAQYNMRWVARRAAARKR